MEVFFGMIDTVMGWIDKYHARGLAVGPAYGDPAWVGLRKALSRGEWEAARAGLREE